MSIGQTGASLGITEWGISTEPGFVGTFTIATDASGRKARSITNSLGQLIRIDEPTGINDLGSIATPNQPTFYKYNPQGKMVHVQQGKTGEPAIQHRYFLYDFLGRLIRVKQSEQEVNTALNILDPVTNNSVWTAAMEYDLVGNLIKTTDAENKQITNTYDNAGRVTKREYSNLDTPTVFYHYDGTGLGAVPDYSKGKLTKVSSSISASQFTSFDNFGRTLKSEQITDGTTYESKYKYNFSGALVEQTYPSGKVVRNFFENDGDLAKVVRNGKVYVSDFNYNASGGVNSLKLGNGRFETAQYNTRQQLTQIGLGLNSNDTSLFKLQYEYGELTANGTLQNVGNVTKQTISVPNASFVQNYKYDALDRIVEAKETNNATTNENWKQTFGYDRFGNRTQFSQQVNGQSLAINSLTLPSIDANTNRFVVNQGFIYDKTGNIIQDIDQNNNQIRKFVFNGENKQVHVKNAVDELIGTYYYNGEGKRVKKTTATETTIFVYDAMGQMVAEYSTLLSTTPTTSYLTSDQLGTPRIITDKNGNVISRRDMMPFGEDLYVGVGARTTNLKYGSTNDEIRQKFTGYLKDKETNLDFAEARYYNNQHGRFTAVDPLLASGKSANPQTFNRFVYVGNKPTTTTDPTGLIWMTFEKDGKTRYKWFDKMKDAPKGWTVFMESFYQLSETKWVYLRPEGPSGKKGDDHHARYGWSVGSNPYNRPSMGAHPLGEFGNPASATYKPNGDAIKDATIELVLEAEGLRGAGTVLKEGFNAAQSYFLRKSAVKVEQYALTALEDGLYPVFERGSKEKVGDVFLKAGDVWKYGTTKTPTTRYTQKFLSNTGEGLKYSRQFKGTLQEALQQEKNKILNFRSNFGILPAGNKIVK